MKQKIALIAIMSVLTVPAYADLASTGYVTEQDDALRATVGTYENNAWKDLSTEFKNAARETIVGAINSIDTKIGTGFDSTNTVSAAIGTKLNSTFTDKPDLALITDKDTGEIKADVIKSVMIDTGAVENGNIATTTIINNNVSDTAAIGLGKINLPTPGTECSTKTCGLVYDAGLYKWEVLTRDDHNSADVAPTGGVDKGLTASAQG